MEGGPQGPAPRSAGRIKSCVRETVLCGGHLRSKERVGCGGGGPCGAEGAKGPPLNFLKLKLVEGFGRLNRGGGAALGGENHRPLCKLD